MNKNYNLKKIILFQNISFIKNAYGLSLIFKLYSPYQIKKQLAIKLILFIIDFMLNLLGVDPE